MDHGKASLLTDVVFYSLVTKLAKDLEGEFYPYFMQIFSHMLPLAARRDVVVIEVCNSERCCTRY